MRGVFRIFAVLAALLSVQAAAVARDVRSERLLIPAGAGETEVGGRIVGYDAVDYVVGARAGQRLSVSLDSPNRFTHFNVTPPGSTDTAIFIGSQTGNAFEGVLPTSGDYRIRVYMMSTAASRGDRARYRLSVSLSGRPERPEPDFADGLAGGPDFWEVTGIGGRDYLNVRTGPGTRNPVVARLSDGEILRNLGCRIVAGRRWCNVARLDGRDSGWVAGDFLREASRQPGAGRPGRPSRPEPEPDTHGPDFWEVTGIGGRDYLNVRTGPGTRNPVVARLSDGEILRNLGCRVVAGQRWCNVARLDGRDSGWVADDFLREASRQPGAGRPGRPSRPEPEPDTHGPDFWEVTGIGGRDYLNVRAGPGTRNPVIARLSDGEILRNLGCRVVAGQRWCNVARLDGRDSGWVAGDFLREASRQPGTGGNRPWPGRQPVGAGPWGDGEPFSATGSLPCATAIGQPSRPCRFGVVRSGRPGSAGVWIAIGGGEERFFQFERGRPVFTNTAGRIQVERSGDLNLIRVGRERYEIPDAVVFGG